MTSQSSPSAHIQDEQHLRSLQDPDTFWSYQAKQLYWHKAPEATLLTELKAVRDEVYSTWTWFPGGEISTCYNCVDRHVAAGNGDQVAIYYDSPATATKSRLTYSQLLSEVETLAGALRHEGVKRGDVVMLYMPMIPAALIGMLAVNRIGAIHSVVFGGFAAKALAQRVDACKPVILLTASCGIIGNRPPIAYQPLITAAMELSSHKPNAIVTWQREQSPWQVESWWKRAWQWLRRLLSCGKISCVRELIWQELVARAKAQNMTADCVPVRSNEPVYIMYTSGTTGSPKGVLRDAGGHAVGLSLSIRYTFNIKGPGDVCFTASDIGWVVGHSYILYAPLLAGASTVLYEGKPVGTPDASAFWRVVEEYKVNMMFTAPSALRAILNDDPDNTFFNRIGHGGGLRSLKALFLAGERSEPGLVATYQSLLARHAAPSSHVIDNWWSTEAPLKIKPGSAGKPMPGFDVRVVDDEGEELDRGSMGNIVLRLPLAPTALRTLWADEQRFFHSYLKRFKGRLFDTGDSGWIDEEGYVHVMSRSDDVLNVNTYRLSSGAIEEAIMCHPLVLEACVTGMPDAIKGQFPFAFITLSVVSNIESPLPDIEIAAEIQSLVRKQVGAFASLGGIIQGKGMIPKTRSGKALRRVLRELLENGAHGCFEKEVAVPSTVEDAAVVEVARAKVKDYFEMESTERKASEAWDKI